MLLNFIQKLKEIVYNLYNEVTDENEISLSQSVGRLAHLYLKYNFIYNNVEDYMHGHKPTIKRVILVKLEEMCYLLIFIRGLLIIFTDDPLLRIITNDFVNQVDSRLSTKVLSFAFLMLFLACYLIVLVFHYKELTQKLTMARLHLSI